MPTSPRVKQGVLGVTVGVILGGMLLDTHERSPIALPQR